MFKNTFLIYEHNLNGDYKNVEPYEYVLETKTNITGEEINDIISKNIGKEGLYENKKNRCVDAGGTDRSLCFFILRMQA